jgi:hypothetical protein
VRGGKASGGVGKRAGLLFKEGYIQGVMVGAKTGIFPVFRDLRQVGVVVERDRWFCRDGEQHHLRVGETIPEPEVATANATYPGAADGFLIRLEV